jgi:hypothetical protein
MATLSELTLLRAKVAALEEAALEEAAAAAQIQKKATAMERLQKILDNKKAALARNSYSKSVPLAAFYDREKVDLVDALIDIIEGLNARVTSLELEKTSR